MKKIILIGIIICLGSQLKAQYDGGNGSGYASADYSDGLALSIVDHDFSAQLINEEHWLNWYFNDLGSIMNAQLEVSYDLDKWKVLTEIDLDNQNGLYKNKETVNGANFYRIRFTSIDNEEVFSKTMSLFKNPENQINIYPNPVSTTLHIEFNEVIKTVSLLTLSGNQVLEFGEAPNKSLRLDLSFLPCGSYILQVNGTLQHMIQKR